MGAGPANATSEFLASLGRVVGIDVSEEVRGNHWLSESHVYEGVTLPFADARFEGCVSDFVLEHIADPAAHFREVRRVLKPGGAYCFRTPNLWHYVTLGSRLTPHAGHSLMANRLRGMSKEAHAPYPTFYRANSRSRIQRLCRDAGLRSEAFEMVEKEPSYGRSSRMAFYPMMWYERLVNRFDQLEGFRINIWGAVRRP